MSKNFLLIVTLGLLLGVTRCTGKSQTYTGLISTVWCQGTHHFSGLTPAACVRKCIQEGSQYALLVGDKLYKLDGNATNLDAYAGEKASVFGTARWETIHVISVSAPEAERVRNHSSQMGLGIGEPTPLPSARFMSR